MIREARIIPSPKVVSLSWQHIKYSFIQKNGLLKVKWTMHSWIKNARNINVNDTYLPQRVISTF